MVAVLALVAALSVGGAAPVQAAGKEVSVGVERKSGVMPTIDGKVTAHGVKGIQVTVTSGGRKVTAKATFKSSNPKVASVSRKGKITVRKNGKATITVKYGGVTKKLRLTAGKHKWKAHHETVRIRRSTSTCRVCGAKFETCSLEYVDGQLKFVRNDTKHNQMHLARGEQCGMLPQKIWYQKVSYISHYSCSCGEWKKGEPVPKSTF